MVGFVLVSHSDLCARGVAELGLMMAPAVPVRAAGGMADGGLGTDYAKIFEAIEEVQGLSDDGVAVIADMGSSFMTAEMVIEDMGGEGIALIDCPFVEGSVAAIVSASCGASLEEVIRTAEEAREERKH
ncbi:MAG: PTS-dependent dihydroxyacetone kinase phosphotransferase subunit DhaM [Lachnospiraceae bacterium]|nr:PTS-dependent dihydroxyacetone kinase phosphotransferase subunit DhaM [Lachnospiraceae bacterium]